MEVEPLAEYVVRTFTLERVSEELGLMYRQHCCIISVVVILFWDFCH